MRKHSLIYLLCLFLAFPGLKSHAQSRKNPLSLEKNSPQVLLENIDHETTAVRILRLNGALEEHKSILSLQPSLSVRTLSGTDLIYLDELQSIQFTPEKQVSIISEPGKTLVSLEDSSLLLSEGYHWHDLEYDDSKWEKPVLSHPNYSWFYIPGACWVWRRSQSYSGTQEVLLIRRPFKIAEEYACRRALLYITADEILHQVSLNGYSLPEGYLQSGDYISADVSHLIKPGKNIVALKVGKSSRQGDIFSGIAFRLDLFLVSRKSVDAERLAPSAAHVILENGDQIFGELRSLTNRWLELETTHGRIQIDRDWVRRIGLNYQRPPKKTVKKRNIFQKILGTGEKSNVIHQKSYSPFAVSLHPEDKENRIGILLKSGEFIKGRILELGKRGVIIKPRYGHDFSIDLREITFIYPNEPGKKLYLQYPEEYRPWRCTIATLDNHMITGLLYNLNDDTLTIKPPYSQSIQFKRDRIVSCIFPFSSVGNLRKKMDKTIKDAPVSVAIIGERDPKGPPYEQSLYYKVQYILSELNIEGILLTPEDMVNPDIFSIKRFPMVFNLDETETYYKTVKKPLDGYNALVSYVKNGGSLVHLAIGNPAFYGFEPQNHHWKRTNSPPNLNKSLKMNILSPGDVSENAQAFELPENQPRFLYFELNEDTPFSRGLPKRVEFPFHTDTRFRPIIEDKTTTTTHFTPLYLLKNDRGTNYGPAMAVIEYYNDDSQPCRSFYVNHLLFSSSYKSNPMFNYVVPKILSLCLPNLSKPGNE